MICGISLSAIRANVSKRKLESEVVREGGSVLFSGR